MTDQYEAKHTKVYQEKRKQGIKTKGSRTNQILSQKIKRGSMIQNKAKTTKFIMKYACVYNLKFLTQIFQTY